MFRSPQDMLFESKHGEGTIVFKGRIKGERIEATSLSAPELDSIASQLEDIRSRIRALSVRASEGGGQQEQPVELLTTVNTEKTVSDPVVPAVADEDILTQIQQVREELRSANLPGLLAQVDELRAASNTAPATTADNHEIQQMRKELRSANLPGLIAQVDEIRALASRPTPPPPPATSVQQLVKIQEQVTRLVGQMNSLQDRVSILEGRVRAASATPSTASLTEAISDAASAAAGAAASAVVNRAALKLEDMVSPGALYNLRKVSDRGPVKYAW